MARTILVAEDSSSIRKFITLALKMAGYNVIDAVDGMDAIEKMSGQDIDLVVTDLNMPNVDGFNLIKTIRENPKNADLPILILTSLNNERDIREAMEVGANSYLIKPFNDKKLLYEISKYLSWKIMRIKICVF